MTTMGDRPSIKPALSLDELRTEAVQLLGIIRTDRDDPQEAEDALQLLLTCAYQAGQIDANDKHLARMFGPSGSSVPAIKRQDNG